MMVWRSVGSATTHAAYARALSATYRRMPRPCSSSSTRAASSTGPERATPPAPAPSWPRHRRRGRPSCRCCHGRRAVRRVPVRRTGRRSTRRPRARHRCVPRGAGPARPRPRGRRAGSACPARRPRPRPPTRAPGTAAPARRRSRPPRPAGSAPRLARAVARSPRARSPRSGRGRDARRRSPGEGPSGGGEPVDGAGEALHAFRDALGGRGGEADPQRIGKPLAR